LPLPFLLSIGVLGGQAVPSRLRCPPHVNLPFGAFFYSSTVESESNKSGSPYVGTVDLEAYYFSLLSSETSPQPVSPPRFPGYQVPIRGQLQLVLKNPNATAIKLFLVPYDLTGLDRGGHGGKTFLRQKSYTVDPDGKERLRYAVHLHFCSPPVISTSSGKCYDPKYYLYNNVRLVFASRGLDTTDKLKVVAEGPQGILSDATASSSGRDDSFFSAYSGPGVEWDMARRKIREREKIRGIRTTTADEQMDADALGQSESLQRLKRTAASPSQESAHFAVARAVHDPNGLDYEFSRSPSPAIQGASLLATEARPSPSIAASPFDMSPVAHALAPSPGPVTLSFERPESPVPISGKVRPPLLSGLSASRPPSRAQMDKSASVEGSH
jgi:hypothetical protein